MSIRSITPLDGRYTTQITGLADSLSEWALIKHRVMVEVEWLIEMAELAHISDMRNLSVDEIELLRGLVADFDDDAALRVTEIERTTNHDVKAVEYYVKEQLAASADAELSGRYAQMMQKDMDLSAAFCMVSRMVSTP